MLDFQKQKFNFDITQLNDPLPEHFKSEIISSQTTLQSIKIITAHVGGGRCHPRKTSFLAHLRASKASRKIRNPPYEVLISVRSMLLTHFVASLIWRRSFSPKSFWKFGQSPCLPSVQVCFALSFNSWIRWLMDLGVSSFLFEIRLERFPFAQKPSRSESQVYPCLGSSLKFCMTCFPMLVTRSSWNVSSLALIWSEKIVLVLWRTQSLISENTCDRAWNRQVPWVERSICLLPKPRDWVFQVVFDAKHMANEHIFRGTFYVPTPPATIEKPFLPHKAEGLVALEVVCHQRHFGQQCQIYLQWNLIIAPV